MLNYADNMGILVLQSAVALTATASHFGVSGLRSQSPYIFQLTPST
ncbi:hypothetical protein [Acaryochloris marina]|nr:hypothetical protein [Acaryochloris marina]